MLYSHRGCMFGKTICSAGYTVFFRFEKFPENSQFPILTKLFNMTMIRKMRRCMDFRDIQWEEICDIERKR